MNVLLVWNGPETAAARAVIARREVPLLERLAKKGVRATVALFGDAGGLRHDLERIGTVDVVHVRMPLPPSAGAIPRIPVAVARLHGLIARVKPDVMEALEPMPAIALGLAARGRSPRAVTIYRRQHGGEGRPRLQWASRLAARLADRVVVSCDAMRRVAAAEDRTPIERIDVAMPGVFDLANVDTEAVGEARRSLGINGTSRVIGVISWLRWEKGIDVLLSALDELRHEHDVHVVIAGKGPEEARLIELAARMPLPVHFVGHRADIPTWYALADIIAIPSRRESFGRVTLEAMSAGRPIVATRVGGLVEAVVEGETGLLVPSQDPPALATALRTLLRDPDQRNRFGAAARARYESAFTIDHMAAARYDAWQRAIASRNAS